MGFVRWSNRLPLIWRTKKWLRPVVDLDKVALGIREYKKYWRDWRVYSAMPNSEPLARADAYPCLYDRTSTHPLDAHYFYQDIWAFKAILASGAREHVDVGSRAILVGMLTAITRTAYVDIRPLDISLENYESQPGSILALPYPDNSIASISCLHVAEHIGLGRYGDPLDPLGTKKAAAELSRVLAPGGILYFSVPVGKPRVCFNAHRIHSLEQILGYFPGLQLVGFAGVTDHGEFKEGINPADVADAEYACGLFRFTKPL